MAAALRLGLVLLVLGHAPEGLGQVWSDGPPQYPHRVQLDMIGRYILSWNPMENEIEFQVEVGIRVEKEI